MNNVSHKRRYRTGAVQIYVDPLPIPPIKSKLYFLMERDYVKIKLPINPTS